MLNLMCTDKPFYSLEELPGESEPLKNIEPVLSIITITKNDLQGLKRTRNSVLCQNNFELIEHIVVDGSDEEDTKAYLLEQASDNFVYVSGVDSGIYQAMNTGMNLARGSIFMWVNSGDSLHDSKSISQILASLPESFHAWGFGITAVHNAEGDITALSGSDNYNYLDHLLGEAFFPHPSSFFSSALVNRVGQYDENIGLAADQIFMLRALNDTKPLFINSVISDFVNNGASSRLPRKKARKQLAAGSAKYDLVPKNLYLTWLYRRMILFVKDTVRSLIAK